MVFTLAPARTAIVLPLAVPRHPIFDLEGPETPVSVGEA
jgi:hypothetical protein